VPWRTKPDDKVQSFTIVIPNVCEGSRFLASLEMTKKTVDFVIYETGLAVIVDLPIVLLFFSAFACPLRTVTVVGDAGDRVAAVDIENGPRDVAGAVGS